MRILFVGPLPEPMTGQALACQVFLDELEKHHAVDVINLSKSTYQQGISSIGRAVAMLGIVWRVWRMQRKADVIYHCPSESFAGSVRDLLIYSVCFGRLPRMVVHLNGGAGMRQILLEPHPLRRLNEFFLQRIGGAIVLGERLVDIYSNVLPRTKIHTVANFAEDYLYTDVAAVDRKFASAKPVRLLFLSNLIPGKGHLELVDAFLTLDETVKDTILIDFAGGFESREHEAAFLRKIDGEPHLRFHGPVRGERRKELYHQAHVFCLPTYYPYEGQPLSILEAYASGCAVITTDHSGIFDTFTPDVNGIAVSKRSTADLSTALQRASTTPERLRTMAIANLDLAEREYRPATFNAHMMRVIDDLGAGER